MNGRRQLLLAGVFGGALFVVGRWTSNAEPTMIAAPPAVPASPVNASISDHGATRLTEADVLRIRDRVVASLPASAAPPVAHEHESPSEAARSADEELQQRLDAALSVGRWSAADAREARRLLSSATPEGRVEMLSRLATSINAGALRVDAGMLPL